MPKRKLQSIINSQNVTKKHINNLKNVQVDHSNVFDLNELNNSLNEALNEENISFELSENDKSCQTDLSFLQTDKSTQTNQFGQSNRLSRVNINFELSNVSELVCILLDSIANYNPKHIRLLSLIVFITLRCLNFTYIVCENILHTLNLLHVRRCTEWVETIIDEGQMLVTLRDRRGSHKRSKFYDSFPELENEAKLFFITRASGKKSNFNAYELACFVNKRFREEYPEYIEELQIENDILVRSVESCRVDILKWGGVFDNNNKRPYFEGHEREDVVEARKKFVTYYNDNKDYYFYPFFDLNSNELKWNNPIRNAKVLISHDESTYRSGEVSLKRWFIPDMAPFFNKGKGRSIMVSKFICQHPSCDIFELSDQEWQKAILKYPDLNNKNDLLNFYPRSANGWLEPKKDHYIDNDVIIRQFERLFKLLQFKEDFKNLSIEILVDNARTHTAKLYDVDLFNKKPSTNCVYENIEWIENGQLRRVPCLDNDKAYRGLKAIICDLFPNKIVPEKILLYELREILSSHPAFDVNSRLERLANQYNIKIIWIPKFHCELNPIEGLWCDSKRWCRTNNDQNFTNFNNLIIESFQQYKNKNLGIKLWNRFWKAVEMYEKNCSYSEVLNELFGEKSKSNVYSKRKTKDFNTKLE